MSATSTLAFRYPGAQPFRSSQDHIFCGRAEDIARLHRSITLNELTVLYGESGLGKTSLLNAGVLPRFSEVNLLAISPRFYAYNKNHKTNPIEVIRKYLINTFTTIEEPDKKNPAHTVFMPGVQGNANEQTLWQLVKSIQWHNRNKYTGIIFIFDQFEELFTYPDEFVEQFGLQFGELLHNRMPENFRKEFYRIFEEAPKSIDAEEIKFIEHAIPTKYVLGIRHDRLGLLKRISPYYSDILLDQNLYQLKPLDRKQAEDAIRIPALLGGPQDPYLADKAYAPRHFDSKWFSFHPDTLQHILHYLTDGGEKPVETTQLQIICQHIETKIVQSEGQVVMVDDVGDLGQISQNYYDNVISELPESEQAVVRDMIEKGLVFEPDQLRLSLYDKQIHSLYPAVTDESLAALVDSHLLRVEERSGERVYEISHDALVAPILAAKKIRDEEAERLRREAEAEAERLRRDAEAEAERQRLLAEAETERQRMLEEAEKQRQKEEEERKAAEAEAERQRLRRQKITFFRFSLIASALAIVALVFATLAIRQTNRAREARIEAEASAALARDNEQKMKIARDSAELLQSQLSAETYNSFFNQGKLLIEQKKFGDALRNFESAKNVNTPERNLAELERLMAECRAGASKEARFNALKKEADGLRDQRNYLKAYPIYKQALLLNFDNEPIQQSLRFCESELRNQCNEELRRARIFLNDGKDRDDACRTIRNDVDPILETLDVPESDELKKKRDNLFAKAKCSGNK